MRIMARSKADIRVFVRRGFESSSDKRAFACEAGKPNGWAKHNRVRVLRGWIAVRCLAWLAGVSVERLRGGVRF